MVLEHDVRRKEELNVAYPLASMIALHVATQNAINAVKRQTASKRQNTSKSTAESYDRKTHARHALQKQPKPLVESVYDIEPSVRKLYLLDFCCRRDPHLEVHVIGETVAFQVRCWNCGKTSFMFDSPDKAVNQWNEMNDD
jgi:hypothetical protein